MTILVTGASRGLGVVVAKHFSAITMGREGCDLRYDAELPDCDAVIHCGGGGLGKKDALLDSFDFHDLLDANVVMQSEINRRILPRMMEKKSGYICHVCSIASGEAVGSVGYNTVKAALAAYVRSLGREMAQHGIVVSGIAPGGFRALDNAMERLAARNPGAYEQFIKTRLPRGHMGEAQELLPLIQLLTSSAGSMMAGCVVPIDAGEGHYYT